MSGTPFAKGHDGVPSEVGSRADLLKLGLPLKLVTPVLLTLQFPSLSTYAPYIPEDATDVKVYVYRLAPELATEDAHSAPR